MPFSSSIASGFVNGLNAAKATTPTLGAVWVASDTNHWYLCLTAGNWTDMGAAGGANPAGSGSELQFRSSASAFGAVAGSSVDANGDINLAPTARTSGSLPYFKITIPTDTTLAATVEAPGIQTITATRQWATGAVTEQRENIFAGPTYSAVAASTFTRAANFYSSSPIQGTNATLSKSIAAMFEASAAAHVPVYIRLAGTPTGNALEVATTANTLLASIGASGSISASDTGGFAFTTGTTTKWTISSGYVLQAVAGTNVLAMTSGGVARLVSTGQYGWASGNPDATAIDTILRRRTTATVNLGDVDVDTAPVAQSITAQSALAGGTSNVNGATTSIVGSLGKSTGNPGRIHLQRGAMITASGTVQQTAIDSEVIGATKALANNTSTPIVNCTLASNTVIAGMVEYSILVFDGTNLQIDSGMFTYQCVNKGGAFSLNTITQPTGFPKQALGSGTLTVTWTITAANPAVITLTANSSLTPSTGYPQLIYKLTNLSNQAVAIQ